jgi:ectoine hydroxylase-related dioxygenase (phytanoyl-CoA dioxygenase family)
MEAKMSASATMVRVENAVDVDAASIKPTRQLRDSNHAIDDFAELSGIYEEQGYLLFRNVLDRASIDRALRRMMDVVAKHGVVAPGATEPLWAGGAVPRNEYYEESAEFAGICNELVAVPANLAVFEKILGEPVCQVPMVSYRSYPPHTPLSMVHQDGFFTQGVEGYRPIWIPLMTITEEIGGLTLAEGMHKSGYLHNLAKPPNFPIPADRIPADRWATTVFHPGDVLVINPCTPHIGLANRSDRVRFSIDTRVQSASNPSMLLGNVAATTADSITLRTADGDRVLNVNADTYIRTGEVRGSRIPLERFQEAAPVGMRVVVARSGDQALMIRRSSEG